MSALPADTSRQVPVRRELQVGRMKAADVMMPDVISVHPDTPPDQVVATMPEHRTGGASVRREDKLVGIAAKGNPGLGTGAVHAVALSKPPS